MDETGSGKRQGEGEEVIGEGNTGGDKSNCLGGKLGTDKSCESSKSRST